ncbi:hypothetical protein DVH24_041312 [Malus domestica]|uniref:Reverse transcriptase Ty1/copia-type domain-containing protein n=1 Tax=Malus domestica TaxID=3750 RepID=A0A498IDL0_MALDO|nr:hypothetical protein DVH24_041312 [Malus domestica]
MNSKPRWLENIMKPRWPPLSFFYSKPRWLENIMKPRWLTSLLFDLGFHSKEPISMFYDNQAAMHIASNPIFHERTKHIEVDCHYVRAQVQANIINTHYTRSHDQLADIFTKPLSTVQFMRILSRLGSRNPLDPA